MSRMLHRRRALMPALLCAMLLSSACFHQIVQTGATAGTTVVDKPWVNTFIFGLVAAPEIDVRQQCPGGVATIETEQSLVNGLVALVTIGIYTPQHVRVTCTGRTAVLPPGARQITIPSTSSPAVRAAIAREAVASVLETNVPVVLHF
jgi:hypothetical protein